MRDLEISAVKQVSSRQKASKGKHHQSDYVLNTSRGEMMRSASLQTHNGAKQGAKPRVTNEVSEVRWVIVRRNLMPHRA
ncbi:hypothetical protein P3744_24010, partial [Vibrio parahaemolyticus]|nr:hypothetical protein [Vibrio parahaemolyticus]